MFPSFLLSSYKKSGQIFVCTFWSTKAVSTWISVWVFSSISDLKNSSISNEDKKKKAS